MFSISTSRLYDQTTFYDKFRHDISRAKERIIIESPFITSRRMSSLLPILARLRQHGIRITINTKPFMEHEARYREQAIWAVGAMQELGIEVLMTGGHHRKLAIIDDSILYEGSLNILSQSESCELMRRIHDKATVNEMLRFTGLRKWCK